MTEQEWQNCPDYRKMLQFVWGKTSDRKLRLFACACCRSVWPLLVDERSRRAVELTEGLVDGRVSPQDQLRGCEEAHVASAALRVFRTGPTRTWEADVLWNAAAMAHETAASGS